MDHFLGHPNRALCAPTKYPISLFHVLYRIVQTGESGKYVVLVVWTSMDPSDPGPRATDPRSIGSEGSQTSTSLWSIYGPSPEPPNMGSRPHSGVFRVLVCIVMPREHVYSKRVKRYILSRYVINHKVVTLVGWMDDQSDDTGIKEMTILVRSWTDPPVLSLLVNSVLVPDRSETPIGS